MGVSTDAILALGIQLDDEEPGFEPYDEDGESAVESGPAYMVYMGEAADGVEIIEHCSAEYPVYFVAVAGSETRAWRGHPKRVAGLAMAKDDEKKVRDFIAKHCLKTTGDFGWHIMSMWS